MTTKPPNIVDFNTAKIRELEDRERISEIIESLAVAEDIAHELGVVRREGETFPHFLQRAYHELQEILAELERRAEPVGSPPDPEAA